MISCYNCNTVNFQSEVENIVTYECIKCKKVNCMSCKSCHAMGCEFFMKPPDKSSNSQRRIQFEDLKRRRNSTSALQPAAAVIKKRRDSVPAEAMIAMPDPSRVFCDSCKLTVKADYYLKHLQTKKHIEACRPKIALEPVDNADLKKTMKACVIKRLDEE